LRATSQKDFCNNIGAKRTFSIETTISQPFPHRARTGGWGFDTRHDRPNYEILAGE
jgi:hypothetical protein